MLINPRRHMPQANQLHVRRDDVNVTAADLVNVKGLGGRITEKGLRGNLDVSLVYTEAWLRGNGCVPIHNLMEDAATAEISRSQARDPFLCGWGSFLCGCAGHWREAWWVGFASLWVKLVWYSLCDCGSVVFGHGLLVCCVGSRVWFMLWLSLCA